MNFIRRHTTLVTNLGLVLVLLIGLAYLVFFVSRSNPFQSTYAVKVEMDQSGGLQANNDVTYRGFRVGKVKSIDLTDKGVEAVAEIDSSTKIPADVAVKVTRLSAAGEQFLDFLPKTDSEPYLQDGAVIDKNVTTPTQVPVVLTDASRLINQLNPQDDPDRFQVIIDELDKALGGGPDQLRSLISGLSVVSAGLDNLLPQTVSLIANLHTITGTSANIQPDLGTLTRSSHTIFDQFVAADKELRRVLDQGPDQMRILGGVVGDVANPATKLAQDFVKITRAARLRTPALRELFPDLRDGLSALGVVNYGGALHTMVSIWPRPVCEYPTKPSDPLKLTDGTVRLWNYCETDNPGIAVRGAKNAPRPNVPNNGAHMPPGVDPNQRSTPLGPGYP